MDQTGISLICAVISAFVALITTILTLRFSKKHSLEQDYDKALEELQKLYLGVKTHIEEKIRSWWINMEYSNGKGPQPSTYIYPIDHMRMLAERYEPNLDKDIEQVANVIQILEGNDDPDPWVPPRQYYYEAIEPIKFSEISESIEEKFKVINQKYNQKRNRKFLSKIKNLLFSLINWIKKLISDLKNKVPLRSKA